MRLLSIICLVLALMVSACTSAGREGTPVGDVGPSATGGGVLRLNLLWPRTDG